MPANATPHTAPHGSELATRIVVLIFSDIVGSTALPAKFGAAPYAAALGLHNELFERLAAEESITIVKFTGDGYFAWCPSAASAVRFALRFQQSMRDMAWAEVNLTTRLGIHLGEVSDINVAGRTDMIGSAANLASRLMSVGLGGQILLSRAPFDEGRLHVSAHPPCGDAPALTLEWLAHGPYRFNGYEEPIEVFEVGAKGVAPLVPPPDAEKAKRALRPGDEETLGWRPAEGLEIPGRAGWRIAEKLGAGGFGEVWAGQHAKTRERRAFKFCFDAERLRALKREVTLTRLLRETLGDREDIVRIYDLRLDAPPYFLESELAIDGNLLQWAEKRGGLAVIPLVDRLELVAATAAALAAAHSVGVLHKDIKPTNVLIFTGKDGRACPRLVDFGIGTLADSAVLAQHGITGAGFTGATLQHSSGTPTYSPPEYLAGKPFTVQGDVYSLGVMLWQLVTAKADQPLAEGWQRDVDDPLLREDIAACVDGDPARRLPSAADLATRLHALDERREKLAHEGAAAAAEAARRKRQRTLTFATTAAVIVAAITIPLALWALREKAHAEKATSRAAAGESKAEAALKDVAAKKTDLEKKDAESRRLLAEAAQSDRVAARDFQKQGRYADALAHLVRACEYQPDSSWAAEQAVALANENAFNPSIATLAGHQDFVLGAQFSPDGSRIVTASRDKTARVWDAASGKPLVTLAGHEDVVRSPQFSPDGSRIVTASLDKTARVWDATSGKLLATLAGHNAAVVSAQFSPDGSRLVTASVDKTARVWDAATGKPLATLMGHNVVVVSAQFSPDGSRIVTASEDRTARVWDTASGKPLATLAGHKRGVLSAQFSPDGSRLVTAAEDEIGRVWDAATGKLLATLVGHESWVDSAQFSPDGSRIVTASQDKTARVWDAASGKSIVTLAGHEDLVWSAEFSPDGSRIVTASQDKTARVWDAATGKYLTALVGHERSVVIAQFSRDGSRIVTASQDNTARVWNAAPHKPLVTLAGHQDFVLGAQFSPDGSRILTASADKTARVWDAASGKPLATLAGHEGSVSSAQFAPDASRIVTASQDKTARVWEAATGRPLATLAGHESWVWSAQFSADGARVVTASDDKTARVWDAATGKLLATLAGHEDVVSSAQFSPDGSSIVTASKDKTARVWDTDSGKPLVTLAGHESWVSSAQFSADGSRVLTASNDKTVRVWDAASGKLLAILAGHEDNVLRPQFSPDGSRIVTASLDKTARVWEAATGTPLVTLAGHDDLLSSAQFSPDGSRIVTAAYDKTARVWDAASGKPIATLAGHGDALWSAQFSPDGSRIVTASLDKVARVWTLLRTNEPTPHWFPNFLRLLDGRSLNAEGELTPPPLEKQTAFRAEVLAALETDRTRYAEIARWHLTPGPDKPVFPGAKMTMRAAADNLISPDAEQPQIEHAYELWPAHPLIHLALARFESSATRAEFLRKFSLDRLLPKAPPRERPALRKRAAELLEQQPRQEQRAAQIRAGN